MSEELKKAFITPFWEKDFWFALFMNQTIGIAVILIIRDFIGKPENIGAVNPIWLDNAITSFYDSLGNAAVRGADYLVPIAFIYAFSTIGKLSWKIISDISIRLMELLESYVEWRKKLKGEHTDE